MDPSITRLHEQLLGLLTLRRRHRCRLLAEHVLATYALVFVWPTLFRNINIFLIYVTHVQKVKLVQIAQELRTFSAFYPAMTGIS